MSPHEGGKSVFTEFRGPGVAAVQIDPTLLKSVGDRDTFNSTGNFTASPPDSQAPLGRIVYGSDPDEQFLNLLSAQHSQPMVRLDVSWLSVGHVDEVMTFLPAKNQRGWVLAIADPAGAYAVLQKAAADGHADVVVRNGGYQPQYVPWTVRKLLDDTEIKAANDKAIVEIDKALKVLRDKFSLTDDEIVRIPVLYWSTDQSSRELDAWEEAAAEAETNPTDTTPSDAPTGESDAAALDDRLRQAREVDDLPLPDEGDRSDSPADAIGGLEAFFPNALNGQNIAKGQFTAAKQFGPVVDGVDLLQAEVERRLASLELTVQWIDNFDYSHKLGGELHCVTNTFRNLDDIVQWWK